MFCQLDQKFSLLRGYFNIFSCGVSTNHKFFLLGWQLSALLRKFLLLFFLFSPVYFSQFALGGLDIRLVSFLSCVCKLLLPSLNFCFNFFESFYLCLFELVKICQILLSCLKGDIKDMFCEVRLVD